MPATRSPRRPASERQLNFLRSLAQERTGLAVANPALAAEVQDTLENGFIARDLIDRVMATPRDGGSAPAARRQDGEQIAPPSAGMRAGRMLLAGGVEATATLESGRHVTVSIRTRKRSGRGWTNAALGEQDSRTSISILGSKVGWLNVDADGRLLLTLRTRRDDAIAAVRGVLDFAAGLSLPAGVERVQEASRCGRCFRTLTDPVSIDRGIGPECFGRDTGSQHIAAVRVEQGSAFVPEPATRPAAPRTETVYRNREDALAAEQRRFEEAEAEMNRLVAEGERREHERAYEQEAREERAAGLVALAAAAERRPTGDAARARDLIAEALDAYFGEPETSFALRIFDQLAAR